MKAILAAFAALFLLAAPALAADAPACKNTMASVQATLESHGIEYAVLTGDKAQNFVDMVVEPMVGEAVANVTGVVLAKFGETMVFGLETEDGCVTDPIDMPGGSSNLPQA